MGLTDATADPATIPRLLISVLVDRRLKSMSNLRQGRFRKAIQIYFLVEILFLKENLGNSYFAKSLA